MANIQIRNVPEDHHATLVRRANEAGQSLQQYMLELIELTASRPTMEEWVQSAERGPLGDVSTDEIVAIIRADRDSR